MACPRPVVSAPAKVRPERSLLGIRLGRPHIEVIQKFGNPSEIQTVALVSSSGQLPDLTGGTGGFSGGFGDSSGMGSAFGGGGSSGIPTLPPAGGSATAPFGMSGGSSGMPGGSAGGAYGMPGGSAGGAYGMPGGSAGGAYGMPGGSAYPSSGPGLGGPGALGGGGPEYSSAVLWIYKRPNQIRYEFLINEDGRVAQISVAAPHDKRPPAAVRAATSKAITIGSPYSNVLAAYGYPERTRLLPGMRFNEAYYSKNYHAAFTFDMLKKMKVVRITIALAD